jgi:hypothetical protein
MFSEVHSQAEHYSLGLKILNYQQLRIKTQLEVLSWHSSRKTEVNEERTYNDSKKFLCDSNQVPPEYASKVLPLYRSVGQEASSRSPAGEVRV